MTLLIKNGRIVDGTGNSSYKADILIEDEQIKRIKVNFQINTDQIINASGLVVCPGFIDMHSHGDLTILKVNNAEPSIMQGATTLVVGVCGFGLAPSNKKVRDYYLNFVNAFDVSKIILYNNLQDFMEVIKTKGISTNLALSIPQGNIRTYVMGMEERLANEIELKAMKDLVREGMEAGAFGMSTGLIYPPGSITHTEEIIELCKVVSEYGGIYISHMRNEGDMVINEGMCEFIEIVKKANIQGHISHWKAGSISAWELTPKMIKMIIEARYEGLNIYADLYPYEEASTSLSGTLLKPWVYKDFHKNLTNHEIRKKILDDTINTLLSTFSADVLENISKADLIKAIISYLMRNTRVISVSHNKEVEGFKLDKALKLLYPYKNPLDALLDFIRDEEGSIMVSFKIMNEKKSIIPLFKQDFVCVGSDGFLILDKNTHPRSYGTFPRVISRYIRKKGIVTLEEGIRKMTGLPASILNLSDRGVIKPNKKADLVIFDYEKIKDKGTYQNGTQFPEGIHYVIVNGKIAVTQGKYLGVLNGQILRSKSYKKKDIL